MKRYTDSAIILFAVLAFVGCSKTEEFQHNPDSALQIESVSGISPFALTTKAVITGNTLPDSDAATGIGIFVTASDGGAYDGHNKGYTNVNFANSGSGWSTATPVYLSDTQGKLYGYFPYNSEANDLKAIPVQSSLNGTDYLYAEPQTVSHSNKSVSQQMNHALSRLHLTIKKGANFTADAPLSKITLNSTAIDATGTMDITTGAISASKKSGETGTVELATDGTITTDGIEKDILLVPADNSEGKKNIVISLMIDGKPAGITLSGENGLDIRSGIQNNVTLTIEDTGIKVTGVGVGEWGGGGSQQVQVGAHTVTIKLSDNEDIANDVWVRTKVDGNNIIIKAVSETGNHLKCILPGGERCPQSKNDNSLLYTFNISNITSDITVTIEYAQPIAVNASCAPEGFGSVAIIGDFYEGERITLNAIANTNCGYKFVEWHDGEGNKIECETGSVMKITLNSEITIKAVFDLALDGLFSVSDGEQVRFASGNLYKSSNGTWGMFEHQYEFIQEGRNIFFQFPEIDRLEIPYDLDWGRNISPSGVWYTLSIDEWKYLLSKRKMTYGKQRYTNAVEGGALLDSQTYKGLFIYPDNYNNDEIGKEGGPSTWAEINALGIVFLPASGYDHEYDNEANYWSRSRNELPSKAQYLYVTHHVYFENAPIANSYFCVRLVSEYKGL